MKKKKQVIKLGDRVSVAARWDLDAKPKFGKVVEVLSNPPRAVICFDDPKLVAGVRRIEDVELEGEGE